MKLNLHPKEFLALYSLLHSVTSDNPEHSSLNEVKNRMKSYAVSALLKKELDPPDDVMLKLWEKTQTEKISNLEKLNKDLDPRNIFVFDEKEEAEETQQYPRRPPVPVVPKLRKQKVGKLGDDRFRHCVETTPCRLGCTRAPIKTHVNHNCERQRCSSSRPRGMRTGRGQPRNRIVPNNVVTPIVWGGLFRRVVPGHVWLRAPTCVSG